MQTETIQCPSIHEALGADGTHKTRHEGEEEAKLEVIKTSNAGVHLTMCARFDNQWPLPTRRGIL